MKIISIRHSGTKTLAKMVYNQSQYIADNCFIHTKTSHMGKIKALINNNETLIAPYRHPCRIWESWKGEQKARPGCDYTLTNFIDEHYNLIDLYKAGKVHIAVLDHETTTQDLSFLQLKTGLNFDLTVTPQNTQFNTINMAVTKSMIDEIPIKFTNFYRTLTRL